MRIIQVVTIITPAGSYGGPVRVAVNQARSLIEAGHEVTLVAGYSGFGGHIPQVFDGVPVKLFPVRRLLPRTGFAGLQSPAMRRWLKRAVRHADVVHVHLARDLVTLPAARIALKANIPLITQTHGMIDASSRRLAKPLDALFTAPILAAASCVFYLTDLEKRDLEQLKFGKLNLVELHNGVPLPLAVPVPISLEVLFLARLHVRKRPMNFVKMAASLHSQFPLVKFAVVGPDEGEGSNIDLALGQADFTANVIRESALGPDQTNSRLARCSIYVLPAINEPFPMSVLEAMAIGKPVVVTDSCGLARVIAETKSGLVVNDTAEELALAVSTLLSNETLRIEMGANARSCVEQHFDMEPVTNKLISSYQSAIERGCR